MGLDVIRFHSLRLSDEEFRITEDEILADLLYPVAPPLERAR